jgi:hypothetical protein
MVPKLMLPSTGEFDLQGSITIKIGQTDRREIEKADIIQGTQTV